MNRVHAVSSGDLHEQDACRSKRRSANQMHCALSRFPAIFEDAKELIRMTAQYNAKQKRARKKAKENRKKDRVREAIAKSQEKKGRSQEG